MTQDTPQRDCPGTEERETLRHLYNEVSGCWSAFQYEIREAISNTNYAVVQHKLDAAKAILDFPTQPVGVAQAAPERAECPNCHNANKYGDYEGPTCEVCMGSGYSNHPDSGEVCQKCGGQGGIAYTAKEPNYICVGWFNPYNDYHGFQQVHRSAEGAEGTFPLFCRASDLAKPQLCPGGVDPGFEECPKCGSTMDDACAHSSPQSTTTRNLAESLCDDCPPVGYETDKTGCLVCPRGGLELSSTSRGSAAK